MKRIMSPFILIMILFVSGCSEQTNHSRAVYMLLDTSGTYTREIGKAQNILKYLLASLNATDSLALARIDSASFSEKDIIAKVTFDVRPSKTNAQKRAFLETINKFSKNIKASAYTDITGAMLQAIEYLNETGAGSKYILIFSDLKEETPKGHVRNFPINFNGIKVVALNVTKLRSDNIDPREYMKRLDAWSKRVEDGDGQWRVINDLERLDNLFD